MDFLYIALLTVINAVFAMSEMALTASRSARLAAMAEAGDKGARSALTLLENPTNFLSTVQVGVTSIGVLNGIVGESAFSEGVAHWLQGLGMAGRASTITATGLVVATITLITIIFGELVPKRIGQLHPELVARWVAPSMSWIAKAAKPVVLLLSGVTAATLKLLRIDTTGGRAVTEEEITASLVEGVDAGVIEQHEHQMVQNVFHLDDRALTSLMVPRSDVRWLEASHTVAQSLQTASASGGDNPTQDKSSHSWYPVCRGGLDDVIGVISVARLLALGFGHEGSIEAYAQTATFVPETLSGLELLEQFRAKASRMVFVVDEYGVVQGIMTPRDLLEAITGELQPGAQVDAWATPLGHGAWLLDGLMPVSELRARLNIKELPEEDRGRYNTVAGLMLYVAGHLPQVGEVIDCGQWHFEVLELDGKRIDRVRAQKMTPEDEPLHFAESG